MNKKLVNVAKKIERYTPPFLYDILWIIFEKIRFFLYSEKNILKKNKNLKDTWKGKRAFLLATWPSIKSEDLKQLTWEDCFSISNFFLHEDINTIKPKFHFFAPYHQPLILENFIEWLNNAHKILPKETKIFLWHTDEKYVKEYNLFPGREIFYLYLSPFPSKSKVDITEPVLAPQTWPLMILPVLIYMWYKEIYLLGCDHNILKDYKKTVTNFYDKSKEIRKNSTDWKMRSNIINEFESNLNVFYQYDFYKKIIKKYKTKIINLSSDSRLDIFEFKKLNSLFTHKN